MCFCVFIGVCLILRINVLHAWCFSVSLAIAYQDHSGCQVLRYVCDRCYFSVVFLSFGLTNLFQTLSECLVYCHKRDVSISC